MRQLFLILLLPAIIMSAQPDFKEGVSLYNRGAYWEALRIFSELAEQDLSLNPQRSASSFMRIKCYNRLGFNQRAMMLARDFPQEFPTSDYLDDLEFLTGEIYLDLGDAREAAWSFASALTLTADRKVRREALRLTESIVASACTPQDLEALATRSVDRTGQFLALLVAERMEAEGNQADAINILFNLRPFIKDEDLTKRAIKLYERFYTAEIDTVHIAVVLPLSGPLSAIGTPILDGIRYAAMKHMDSTDQQIILHTFDNESKLTESINIAREIRLDPRIIAQIGPLTNENIKGTAAVLEGRRIPILAPAATEDNLTDLSKGIFQFRATRERKAQALAEYAVKTLGLQTFAIIAPSTEYGQQLADNFSTRVDELGGLIQYQGWYVGQPKDLSTFHFRQIRELGLEELYEKMQADSLRLDSLLTGLISEGDSINIYEEQLRPILIKQEPSRSDSLRIELSHIDGMFFPIHRGSIPFIASQLAHNNLETHVLGDENWLDTKTLKKNARYLPNLTLVTGDRLGFEEIGEDYSLEYEKLFKRNPAQYDLMGYDVMGLLLTAARFSGNSETIMWDILMNSPTYEGLVHQIQWGGDTKRENSLVFLMHYADFAFQMDGYFDNIGFFSMDSVSVDSIEVSVPSTTE
ncbi:MAG: penicillin-binding protein activator [Candidatus Marinimicrobia bacterium]|nr:penicillin-binding protein activator [Candidatus Neomarinimicrobiota bacterium]